MKEIYFKNKELLKKFELNQRDAFNLLYIIKQFNIFNKLPITAMNILSEVESKPSFQNIYKLHVNKTEEMNFLISNTLNSQVFIDHENKVGRKGLLTYIDKDTAEIKHLWAVINLRVFCLYKSSSYLNIYKIYRISMVQIKDLLYSPCFFIYISNDTVDSKATQSLICALNFREKEYWINTLNHHREQYKDKDTD